VSSILKHRQTFSCAGAAERAIEQLNYVPLLPPNTPKGAFPFSVYPFDGPRQYCIDCSASLASKSLLAKMKLSALFCL
jgi:hypothetical protein